jgi:hypothetical protein
MLRRMSDPNQAGGDAGDADAGEREGVAPVPAEPPPGEPPSGPAAEPEGLTPRARRGLVSWFVVLAIGGAAGLLTGHGDLALLLSLAGLYVAARAADVDRTWYLFHLAAQVTVPLSGLLMSAGLAAYAQTVDTLSVPLDGLLGACLLGALTSLVLLVPVLTHNLTVLLFRTPHTTRVMRLTTRIALLGLVMALPLRLLWPDLLRFLQEQGETLADASSLVAGLAGEVALAFAAIGLGIDRSWRASVERLGLGPVRGAQWLVAVAGLAALVALNSALEQVQLRWFPALAEADRETVEWMVRDLSPALAVLLGICAGAGEEIAMRGALQPRLGLLLSSVVFAVLHVQYTWFGMLTVALIGILLGVIRQRTNTTVAIVVHAAYDVLVAVLTAR